MWIISVLGRLRQRFSSRSLKIKRGLVRRFGSKEYVLLL